MAVEIFKAGRHTDSAGMVHEFSDADVALTASVYQKEVHEAPVVIGHPKGDAPAYGWVRSLSADKGRLSAEFGEVDENFAALVRAGRYKKISASFYPPQHPSNPKKGSWYLRHVGFLGAQPPAIKGLAAAHFAEDDGCVSFNDYAHEHAASLFRKIREWLIAQFGAETADSVIPDWEIESINELSRRKEVLPNHDFAEEEKETDMQEALAKAQARAAQAQAELAAFKAEQRQREREASQAANADFAEKLTLSGKLKPADKNLITRVLDFTEYPAAAAADFGEGDIKKPLSQAVRDFLTALPPVMDFAETAIETKIGVKTAADLADFAEADPESLSHHRRALALAKQAGIAYEEAARRTV